MLLLLLLEPLLNFDVEGGPPRGSQVEALLDAVVAQTKVGVLALLIRSNVGMIIRISDDEAEMSQSAEGDRQTNLLGVLHLELGVSEQEDGFAHGWRAAKGVSAQRDSEARVILRKICGLRGHAHHARRVVGEGGHVDERLRRVGESDTKPTLGLEIGLGGRM